MIQILVVLLFSVRAFAFPVEVGEAPGTALALTLKAIQSAKESLWINIYELRSPEVTQAILDQIRAHVQVTILEEGDPTEGMNAEGDQIIAKLATAMKEAGSQDHFWIMTKKAGPRRYHFDHAKYIVIDGKSLLVGSENYASTGNPKPGAIGNRGWEVLIHDPKLAEEFSEIFKEDTDFSKGDLMAAPAQSATPSPAEKLCTKTKTKLGSKCLISSQPEPTLATGEASRADKILSPNSLPGLVEMLKNAKTSIDLELMTFYADWGAKEKSSPLYQAVLDAAERGVSVRVLLNDERAFGPGKSKNAVTAQLFNQAAKTNPKLKLEARIANLKAMGVDYIHNKGVLIDRDQTLISSINWDENSVMNNREAAVLITSTDVNQHYEALFNQDWKVSENSL